MEYKDWSLVGDRLFIEDRCCIEDMDLRRLYVELRELYEDPKET